MTTTSDTVAAPNRISKTRPNRRSFYRRYEHAIIATLGLVILITLWELLSVLGVIKPLFMSSPSRILAAAGWLAANGLWEDVMISATEFGIGFSAAVLVGVPLGILLGWYRWWHAVFDPYISVLYVTPRVVLLPLLILWLGIGLASKVMVVFLGAVFPILINVIAGIKTIDESLVMCARSFGAGRRQIFATVALPGSVPFILAGLRIGVGRALVGVVVGEMVASTGGIGHMISVAGAQFQTDRVFVGVIMIAMFGYGVTAFLNRLERRFEAWRPQRS